MLIRPKLRFICEDCNVKSSSFFHTSKSSFEPAFNVDIHKSIDDGISKLSISFISLDALDFRSICWSHDGAK